MIRSLPFLGFLLIASCHAPAHYPVGGYPYPEHIADKDTSFYYYPVRDKMSRRDSFRHGWDAFIFQAFDEPNLSLKPLLTPEFRFHYSGWREELLVITLTPGEITVKRHNDSHLARYMMDSGRLTPTERRQVQFIWKHYGESARKESMHEQRRLHFVDSMVCLYPQLQDPAYYWQLVRKELIPDPDATPYTFLSTHIEPAAYKTFVDSLNASGYWEMPYKRECNVEMADGPAYFSLEANTPNRYNFVNGYSCPNDTNRFYKACEQLIHLAGLDKEFHLLWIEPPPDTTARKPLVIENVQLEDVKEPKQQKRKKLKTLHPD
jgi:hypothetical protein